MKKLNNFILFAILMLSSFLTLGQTENYKWFELPKPNGASSSVKGDLSSIESTPSGDVYFIYYDYSNYELLIKKLDILSNTWQIAYNEFVTGVTMNELHTYQIEGKIYIGVSSSGVPNNLYFWEYSFEENLVTNLYYGAPSSMNNSGRFDFVVDENTQTLYSVVEDANLFASIDVYDLFTQSNNTIINTGYNLNQKPTIAKDIVNGDLYIAANSSTGEYKVLTSPMQPTLMFEPFDGNAGLIPSTLYTGDAIGTDLILVEKEDARPDIVLSHDTGGILEDFRVGALNANADANIIPSSSLTPLLASGGNQSTFSIGFNTDLNNMIAYEIKPDGNVISVALNNNPVLESSHAEGIVFDASNNNRLFTFYHPTAGGDGSFGGRFMLTNNPPSITYTTTNACVGSYKYVINDITFADIDGDVVELLNNGITSSDSTIIHPNDVYTYQNQIEVLANAEGAVDLTFLFSDGLDTISHVVTINSLQSPTVNYTETIITSCKNEGSIDLNDFVTEPGGKFWLGESTIDDGIVNFNELNLTTLPYTESINYSIVDQNGCYASPPNAANLTVYDVPSAELTVTNTSCGNTDGEVEAININSPNGAYYTYWNNGTQNANLISNLSSGNYFFNLIDQYDCKFTAQANVVASDFMVTGTVLDPTCHDSKDGSIDIEVFGGSGNYSVLWSTGHSVEDLSNLRAGNYVVTVTDDSGCKVTEAFNLENPDEFFVSYSTMRPTCGLNDGSIGNFYSEGGVEPFAYQWSTGESSQTLSNIGASSYSVIVTDANGCSANWRRQLNPLNSPYVDLNDKRNTTCNANNGMIDLDISPTIGEQITAIEWSNGATTEDINNLSPGEYECVVYQTNGCNTTERWRIENRRPPKTEICIVTVDTTTNTNLVVWQKSEINVHDISHYNIYRETANVGQYQKIDTVNYTSISVFNDVVASPENRSWRYKISAVNECGVESGLSRSHKTIHLVKKDLGGGEKGISWDNYEGFNYSSYDLLRYTDVNGWEVIEAGIPYNNTPYRTDTPPSEENLDYMIEVIPPGGTCTATEGKAQDYNSSRSNKPSSKFNPGDGTGDPNNSLAKEENDNFTVALYPNPSSGRFEVAMYHNIPDASLKMEVLDLSGKIIHENQVKNGVNYVDLENIDAGVYFVKLYDATNFETIRIVVK